MKRGISIFILFLVASLCARAQQIAIKTNALSYLAFSPNIGLEMVTGEHSSVDLSLYGSYVPVLVNSKMLAFQPEYRYWFNGRPMTREYIGVVALLTTYDFTLMKNVYDGDAAGLGLSGGYVFNLNERWNFELSASFGAIFFNMNQHYVDDNLSDFIESGDSKANAWGYKLLPIKLGVSFSYILK